MIEALVFHMISKAITIIGGGLAGLSLGIGLRGRKVPVKILEAAGYPRHRVCGEFISGRGLDVLHQLGLKTCLERHGARKAETAAFFFGARCSAPKFLPEPALCISRHALDQLLADQFRSLGGELLEHNRWQEPSAPEGFVLATGRRRAAVEGRWRWFGVKAHVRNVALSADLEMHRGKNGYVGLCRLADGEVNACGLFRRRADETDRAPVREMLLRGQPGTALHERMSRAEFDEHSLCSVAGLQLNPRKAAGTHECRIGDALTMIAPLTGNGMSMAFEAAALAMGPLTRYSQGHLGWAETRGEVATACDAAFRRRLAWASLAQTLMLGAFGNSAAAPWLLSSVCWKVLFHLTR